MTPFPIMTPLNLILESHPSLASIRVLAKLGIYIPQQDSPVIQKLLLISSGNLAKKALTAAVLSLAVRLQLQTQAGSLLIENPTPGGAQKNSRFALWFHEQGLKKLEKCIEPDKSMLGPISWANPSRLEHPGPPFSHNTTSSLRGLLVEVTNKQWTLISGSFCSSRQPLNISNLPVKFMQPQSS